MSNTEKHRKLFSEPIMGDKPAEALPGIGDVWSAKLKTRSGVRIPYTKAYQLFGQFLSLNKNEEEFQKWLKRTLCARDIHNHFIKNCSDSLKKWCNERFDRSIKPTYDEKLRMFITEAMGEKPIREIPGLEMHKPKAYEIFGQFLIAEKDEGRFQNWLNVSNIVDPKCPQAKAKAKDCSATMKTWCERYFDKPFVPSDHEEPGTDQDQPGGFIAEPMGEKLITEIPGMEPKCDKAYQIFGRFLIGEKKYDENFQNWVIENFKVTTQQQAQDCNTSMDRWCEKNFDKSIPSAKGEEVRMFVDESMGEKLVSDIPGMDGLSCKDGEIEYHKAYQVFGQFLMLKKNEEEFQKWLKENSKATPEQARECSKNMKEWCKKNFDGLIMPNKDEKFKEFVGGRMGAKMISDIPGLDENCKTDDYYMAYQVFAKFLTLNMDEKKFKDWLKKEFHVDDQRVVDCSAGMTEWCERHFY